MRRSVVIVAVAVLALVAGVRFIPWLTAKRDVELSSPTSPALITGQTWLSLAPGHEACVNPVDLAPGYRTAHLLLQGPAQIALTITAPGYSATNRASTRGESTVVVVPLKRLPRSGSGVACVRNEGARAFQIAGNTETRTQTHATSLVDGKPIAAQVPISFWRGERETRATALLDGIPKMGVFKPVGAWFFWLMLPLVLLAVPALIVTALVIGLRED